jgi:hypothetical protein
MTPDKIRDYNRQIGWKDKDEDPKMVLRLQNEATAQLAEISQTLKALLVWARPRE